MMQVLNYCPCMLPWRPCFLSLATNLTLVTIIINLEVFGSVWARVPKYRVRSLYFTRLHMIAPIKSGEPLNFYNTFDAVTDKLFIMTDNTQHL